MNLGIAKARIVEDVPKLPVRKLPTWSTAANKLEGEYDSMLDFCMWLQKEETFNMLVSLANRGELK